MMAALDRRRERLKAKHTTRQRNLDLRLDLTLSSRLLYPCNSADRDRPSATSIKPTTAFRAAIGTAPLAYMMRVTSELLVVARAACGLCLKDTCRDEQDDCERVGGELHSKPTVSYAHRTVVFRPSYRSGPKVL